MFDAYTAHTTIYATQFYISESCKPLDVRQFVAPRVACTHPTCIGAVLFTIEDGFMSFWWPQRHIMDDTRLRKDMSHRFQTIQILASKSGLRRRVSWFKCINKVKTYQTSCSGRATGRTGFHHRLPNPRCRKMLARKRKPHFLCQLILPWRIVVPREIEHTLEGDIKI